MIGIAFSFGLLSSLHCAAMCAPLQAVIMGQWLNNKKKGNWIIYHAGRLSTYMLLGLIASLFGQSIGVPNWQGDFTIMAGILLLAGYFGFKFLQWDRKFNQLLVPLLRKLQPKAQGKKKSIWFFSSGALNGFLPCGMVYAALLPAAGAASLSMGMFYMLVFGLGTIPLLAGLNLFSNKILLTYGKFIPKLIPISVVLIATLLIIRGLELDIPYLSPALPKAGALIEACD
ncbi:MAG: sulfite exporter TauE/SafE [Roseivirga sp.]|jgi:sulfite exporter TauE/SafE